jgi:hypothetical protein
MRRVRRANLLLHFGELAVDALQAEAEGAAGIPNPINASSWLTGVGKLSSNPQLGL